MMNSDLDHEADRRRERERQQALLQVLWRRDDAQTLAPWVRAPTAARTERGLHAYRANAGASAERALAACYPTVQALIGPEAFAALARSHWLAHPPLRGDLACFGTALPEQLATDPRWAEWPYLADCARLDAALFAAEAAPDAVRDDASFVLLAQEDPAELQLRLAPAVKLLRSPHPIVAILDAHREPGPDAFERARTMMAAGIGEAALVWRDGWKARAVAISDADAAWVISLRAGATVGEALEQAGDGFDFEAWLVEALQRGLLLGVSHLHPPV